MRLKIDAALDYDLSPGAAVLLQLEVAQLSDQKLVEDRLTVDTEIPLTPIEGLQGIGRRLWTGGSGRFAARYQAVVEVERRAPDIAGMEVAPLAELPGEAVHYLWPSRYCQSDLLHGFAARQFGHLKGGEKVAAISEWTRSNLAYVPGCSDATTTAHDTFQQKKGICRDFAHVMISLTRALDIPARMVSAYAWGLKPPDFHAVVEVWLDGGWQLIDPTGLAPIEGMVRIGVGRDATDISFMTIFGGAATLRSQSVGVERLD